MLAAAIATLAIVTQDRSSLRAAARDSAQQQAQLWAGDALEIRGRRMDYLQVYDHKRERAGYVLASQVRTTSLQEGQAPELLAVLRFVRDTPGQEALGIGYTAAFLRAATVNDITPEVFDAMGGMAERLARRASQRAGQAPTANDATIAAHLEGVTAYGVRMLNYEREGAVTICYDGEAFRRVLAMPAATLEQQARAVLGLTRHACVDPNMMPLDRYGLDQWRAQLLQRVDTAALPETLKNRLRLRRAGVWATLAHEEALRGRLPQTLEAGQHAIAELAAVNKAELTDDDLQEYADAAVRTGASRWASEVVLPRAIPAKVQVQTEPGSQPGETCVLLVDPQYDARQPLFRRCTYSVVWTQSASVNAAGTSVALAVQPLDTWRELWLLRKEAGQWTLKVMPAGTTEPGLGYVEFAGWVAGSERMLVAREYRDGGRIKRSFELVRLDTLESEKKAPAANQVAGFERWQDPTWKRMTISQR